MLTLGDKIRAAREKLNMTPQELATAVGISQPYMSQIENNARTPGREKLIKIAQTLKVPLDFLASPDIVVYDKNKMIAIEVKSGKSNDEAIKKTITYYATLDKAEKAGLSEQQIKDAIEFAIKMKTQA